MTAKKPVGGSGGGVGATTWVALMRGINVGGHRPLPMARLRELCVARGWDNPRTYIQSGNLIVGAPGPLEAVRAALEAMIAAEFGFATDVIVRAAFDWAGYVAANPFADDAQALPKSVHLCLSRAPLAEDAARKLCERALPHERVVQAGGALWIDYGRSIADSKLTPAFIDRCAGSTVTGRNWNSVLKIAALIGEEG
ncbi:DUF1697 domain-containing protein [Sphingobium aquiterrae]|uniref:DUF1697 domain-containing protein n=1 Tax=Sphingobium aquiterrae TaxID=2038656 RepID=UPI0030192499